VRQIKGQDDIFRVLETKVAAMVQFVSEALAETQDVPTAKGEDYKRYEK
jgi:hypothetical protein